MKFLSTSLIKLADEAAEEPIETELEKYRLWYQKTTNKPIAIQGLIDTFKNNKVISKYIKSTRRGHVLVGHRFLDYGQKLDPSSGDSYAIQDVYELEMSDDNAGIPIETPEQYYQKILTEYNKYKTSFGSAATYDVDTTFDNMVAREMREDNQAQPSQPQQSTTTLNGRILPAGVNLRNLPEPTLNYLTDEYHFGKMSGYFSDNGESDDETVELN